MLDVLFPGRCLLCGCWLLGTDVPVCAPCRLGLQVRGGNLCGNCGTRLVSENLTCLRCRDASFAFIRSAAVGAYDGALKSLIEQFKFGRRRRLAPLFARLSSEAMARQRWTYAVVPVPPRPGRRAPDSVELVARCLERNHGAAVLRLLERTGGAEQKSLDYSTRRANLSGRIRMSSRASTGSELPADVVILDDLFTTGATLDTCTRVLVQAGCKRVYGLTLAIEE